MITLRVYGEPAPQGSKAVKGTKPGKHGQRVANLVESSPLVKPWRDSVAWAAKEAIYRQGRITGPVIAEMTFTRRKPLSAPKRKEIWPATAPDLSKLVRSTEDALTTALIWEDDGRVVECLARKVYPGQHQDALDSPGVVIRLRGVNDPP